MITIPPPGTPPAGPPIARTLEQHLASAMMAPMWRCPSCGYAWCLQEFLCAPCRKKAADREWRDLDWAANTP